MHLIVQIPCYNEEKTLSRVLADIPKKIDGVDFISTLVIDDGSTDKTCEIAEKEASIVTKQPHSGLSMAYLTGLKRACFWGADIIVNTDGDNQYNGNDIKRLVKPIIEGKYDVVIGCRDIYDRPNSLLKKILYKLGNRLVMCIIGNIPDVTSGFRAITKEVAVKIKIKNKFSYTVESLVRIQEMGYRIGWIEIKTNPKTRLSRLYKTLPQFLLKQGKVILWAIIFKLLRKFD